MKNKQIENKVLKEAAKIKKDFGNFVEESTTRFDRFDDDLNKIAEKAKGDIKSKIGDGMSQINDGLETKTKEAKETIADFSEMVKKDVGDKLVQYNAKTQEFADKMPGGFGKKAVKYPWIVAMMGLVIGLILGSLRKPSNNLDQGL